MHRNNQCIFPALKGNHHGILVKKLFASYWHTERQVRQPDWDAWKSPHEKGLQLHS